MDAECHPQTIAVVQTRAEARGVEVVVQDPADFVFGKRRPRQRSSRARTRGPRRSGCLLLQYPATDGAVHDYRGVCEQAHAAGALVTVATDLLALALLTPPGEWGADIAVGNSQRFGVPLGYGGPHAAFFATKDAYKRHIPGRIIGVSNDADGKPALRMALQTREQHIRRDKATSNVCTAQVLLAVMASMYAVYHGPEGIHRIATRVHRQAMTLADALRELGLTIEHEHFFDTVAVTRRRAAMRCVIEAAARAARSTSGALGTDRIVIALDETVTSKDLADIVGVLRRREAWRLHCRMNDDSDADVAIPESLRRSSGYLTHPVFHRHRSETEMLRYMRRLEAKDLSLTVGDDPARLVHHEAQRHDRDDAGELAGVRRHASVRAARRRRPGTSRCSGGSKRTSARSPGSRGLAAAERRLAGRVRRPAGHPRLSSRARRRCIATSA